MATKSFGVWLTFAIFTLNMIVQNVVGDITYQEGWVIPYPGTADDRAIYLVSDVKQYEVTPLNYDGENVSDGQCETLLSEGHYSGPCLTNVTAHNQIFSVECFQNASNTATVTFFATNGSATDQEAQIVTAGTIWGGFTNEEINSPLRQSTTEPIVGKGDRISAVFSCYNDNRGGIGVSNTTTSSS